MIVRYDIIVVGAGHAGCEAAAAAARLGSKTLLITMDMNKIAQMSCNPAVGGIAKGQIVREIDALGGQMGKVTDRSSIQFRMLNRSKGAAMWSPRSQCDRKQFINQWTRVLSQTENLNIWQDIVTRLRIEEGVVRGVETMLGMVFEAGAVVLTNGTFLNGKMHFGKVQIEGGRISEPASFGLTEQLASMGMRTARMKTGTPCRIDKRSIDFAVLTEQLGDDDWHRFSYLQDEDRRLKQMSCWITYTNERTHEIIRRDIAESPMYNGQIQSIGPRYCPSIETKIMTFADKDAHQLFIEPEGVDSNEYYLNGFSSSLPIHTQIEALHSIRGLEHAVIYRPGYAIEYDFFDPTQLRHTLETKLIKRLFFAGQINGTTGYEEAAGQGLIAGVNAHLSLNYTDKEFVLSRSEAYIGVLIDDLVSKGVDEPYRMFTSRAEYRILLRQDNADQRLTEKSAQIGLADAERIGAYKRKMQHIEALRTLLEQNVDRGSELNILLESRGYNATTQKLKASELISRPNISAQDVINICPKIREFTESITENREEIIESCEIEIKYKGYIEREKLSAEKLTRLENIAIPANFDYTKLQSLSTEARQKLSAIMPKSIGQASRIPGVSPNDISVLLVLMGR